LFQAMSHRLHLDHVLILLPELMRQQLLVSIV